MYRTQIEKLNEIFCTRKYSQYLANIQTKTSQEQSTFDTKINKEKLYIILQYCHILTNCTMIYLDIFIIFIYNIQYMHLSVKLEMDTHHLISHM